MKGRLPVAGWLLLALGVAAPSALASSHDLPLAERELIREWTRPAPATDIRRPVSPAAGRYGALTALAGGRAPVSRCATPLMVALHQNVARLNEPTRQLLETAARPQPAGTLQWRLSAGGEFRIHYTTDPASPDRIDAYDGDLNGVPDGVDRLAAELTSLLARFVHELDWAPAPAPVPAGAGAPLDRTIDVHLVSAHGGAGRTAGYVMPRVATPPVGIPADELPEASDAIVFLDSGLAGAEAVSRPAVAHMLAHIVQLRESARESAWWHEASATWLESRLEHNAAAIAAELGAGGSWRSRGLSDEMIDPGLEAFLWPHYLEQSGAGDSALIRELWEEMGAVPGNNTFEAMDRVLRRRTGGSLADEARVFNIWNLFLGKSDDRRHYPFAASLPTPTGEATYEMFPARGASLAGPIPPLGSAMIRLLGDGSRGGLMLRFDGADPGDWAVSLLVHPVAHPGEVRYTPVEIDAAGRGAIAIPWRSLAVIDLVIQNLAAPGTAPADYAFAIDYDPTVPFDLLGFTATESPDGAVLVWSTEREERLAGWNILRGASVLGPFSLINRFLIPATGEAGPGMSYLYVDSDVAPGRKYYYHLEGVTLEGFTERSHPAGLRLGGAQAARESAAD